MGKGDGQRRNVLQGSSPVRYRRSNLKWLIKSDSTSLDVLEEKARCLMLCRPKHQAGVRSAYRPSCPRRELGDCTDSLARDSTLSFGTPPSISGSGSVGTTTGTSPGGSSKPNRVNGDNGRGGRLVHHPEETLSADPLERPQAVRAIRRRSKTHLESLPCRIRSTPDEVHLADERRRRGGNTRLTEPDEHHLLLLSGELDVRPAGSLDQRVG
jgi:hypothetical protein